MAMRCAPAGTLLLAAAAAFVGLVPVCWPVAAVAAPAAAAAAKGATTTAAAAAADGRPAPLAALTSPVMDAAHLLPADTAAALAKELAALREATGIQFVVATTSALGDETVEQVALSMAEAWQIGRKGQDDGLLLLVAPADRRVRLEVGYGLEGVLPDLMCHRLIDATLAEYPGGMDANATVALARSVTKMLLRHGGARPAAARQPASLVDGQLAAVAAIGMALFALGWATLGRRYWAKQPFRPVRPPAGARAPAQRGGAGTFRGGLLYNILFFWLSGFGRGGRGRGQTDDDRPGPPQGGGGGTFGGGGSGGRW